MMELVEHSISHDFPHWLLNLTVSALKSIATFGASTSREDLPILRKLKYCSTLCACMTAYPVGKENSVQLLNATITNLAALLASPNASEHLPDAIAELKSGEMHEQIRIFIIYSSYLQMKDNNLTDWWSCVDVAAALAEQNCAGFRQLLSLIQLAAAPNISYPYGDPVLGYQILAHVSAHIPQQLSNEVLRLLCNFPLRMTEEKIVYSMETIYEVVQLQGRNERQLDEVYAAIETVIEKTSNLSVLSIAFQVISTVSGRISQEMYSKIRLLLASTSAERQLVAHVQPNAFEMRSLDGVLLLLGTSPALSRSIFDPQLATLVCRQLHQLGEEADISPLGVCGGLSYLVAYLNDNASEPEQVLEFAKREDVVRLMSLLCSARVLSNFYFFTFTEMKLTS